jgi:hypothetical protein
MLSEPQIQMIGALLRCPSGRAACRKCGISERTLTAWRGDAEFGKALADARATALQEAVTIAAAGSGEGMATLRRLLKSKREVIRLRAAVALHDRALRGVEFLDVLERVEALERRDKARRKR